MPWEEDMQGKAAATKRRSLKSEEGKAKRAPRPAASERPALEPVGPILPAVQCLDCRNFERIDDRPHIGTCAAGQVRHLVWDTDVRVCPGHATGSG